MPRFKDVNWNLSAASNGSAETWQQASIAVLMDIRDELQRLNAAIYCPNFMAIPHKLDAIKTNTTPKRKRRTVKVFLGRS